MEHILVTGSNRGIGLAIVEDYLKRDDVHVFAACRTPDNADALQQLASDKPVTVIQLDINDERSINASVDAVKQHTDTLDVLFNNAGIYPKNPEHVKLGHLEAQAVGHVVTTNAVSPLIVSQAYVDLLKNSANGRIVMVSSQMGSLQRSRHSTSGISYRMSKAAMNMATVTLSNILKNDGITVITTHPGHVETDMGGKGAPVSPAESAAGLVAITEKLTIADTGNFYNYNGDDMPW